MLRYLYFIVGIFFLFGAGTSNIYACLPPTPNADNSNVWTLERYIETSTTIFVGTVVDGEPYDSAPDFYVYEPEVEVSHYLKGEGSEVVRLGGFYLDTNCSPSMLIGDRWIFFAQGEYSGLIDVVFVARIDEEAAIFAVTGQRTMPEPLPIEMRVRRIAEKNQEWLFALVPLGLLSLGLVGFLAWRRGRTGKKKKG